VPVIDRGVVHNYRIAGNFRRTLFSEISETSGIFRNFFYENAALRTENIFPKYSLKRIFRKFKLMKISGYTVYVHLCKQLFLCDVIRSRYSRSTPAAQNHKSRFNSDHNNLTII